MPLNLFYTMVQKSQKWPKTQIKGGPALTGLRSLFSRSVLNIFFEETVFQQIFKGGSYLIFAASYEHIAQRSPLLFFWSGSDAKATQVLQKGVWD